MFLFLVFNMNNGKFCILLLVPQNNVMDVSKVMDEQCKLFCNSL